MRYFRNSIFGLILAMLFVACGGGGSGDAGYNITCKKGEVLAIVVDTNKSTTISVVTSNYVPVYSAYIPTSSSSSSTVSSSSSSSSVPTSNRMEIGKPYNVYTGDTINILSDDTVINVVHTLDNDIKVVTLISGNADLLRGNYVKKD